MSGAAVQYGQRRDLFGVGGAELAGQRAPHPVRAAQRGRRVDARFGPQGKIIRQRDNAQLSGAGQRTAHQPGGKALLPVQPQVCLLYTSDAADD